MEFGEVKQCLLPRRLHIGNICLHLLKNTLILEITVWVLKLVNCYVETLISSPSLISGIKKFCPTITVLFVGLCNSIKSLTHFVKI